MGEIVGNILREMTRKPTGMKGAVAGVLLGAGLMLAGCGGSPSQGEEAARSAEQGGSSETPPSSGTASTAPATTAPATTAPASTAPASPAGPEAPALLPLAELDARISSLLDAQGRPFLPVSQDQLGVGMSAVEMALDSAVVTPAECKDVARRNMAELSKDVVVASGVSAPDSLGSVTVVALMATEDTGSLDRSLDVGANGCGHFTIEIQGQVITATVEELPLDPVGEKSSSYLMTQVLPTGETTYMLGVTAVSGTASASAQKIASSEPDGIAQDDLRRLAGELLTDRVMPAG